MDAMKPSESEDERKPEKKRKRTATRGRFSHHTCFHHDWWNGVLGMPPDEVGVYERIIKLMYIRRAALRDDDRELAQLCHCEIRVYRRIKASLIARGRVVVDEENGLIYDERTIRELVDAGFFSEDQTKRALKRHTKTPMLTVVDERYRSEAPNVVPLRDEDSVSVAQVLDKVGCKSDVSLVDNSPQTEQKQDDSVQNGHANQYPVPIPKAPNPEKAAPQRAAMPPRGGGAQQGAKHKFTRAEIEARREQFRLDALAEAEAEQGKEEAPAKNDDAEPAIGMSVDQLIDLVDQVGPIIAPVAVAADRKAKRS